MCKSSYRKGLFSFLLFGLLAAGLCHGQEQAAGPGAAAGEVNAAAPSVRFLEIKFEAGTVKEGAVVTHAFAFVNVGGAGLMIKDLVPA